MCCDNALHRHHTNVTKLNCICLHTGTCKLDGYCAASVEVSYLESGVEVVYNKTHYGHSLNLTDLIHVRVHQQDKELMAGEHLQLIPQ